MSIQKKNQRKYAVNMGDLFSLPQKNRKIKNKSSILKK